jgi:outer membrane protein TolC
MPAFFSPGNLRAAETGDAQTGAPSAQVVTVPIKGLIREVVRRNPALLYERIQLAVSERRMDFEKNIFEPEFFSSLDYSDAKAPNSAAESISRGGLETYEEEEWAFRTGFEGLLPSGANWRLEYLQSRTSNSLIDEFKDYGHEYESRMKATLTQPLLKGFGSEITLAEYDKAVLDGDMLKGEYETTVMELISIAVREYWKLYGARNLVESLKKSVGLLEKSVELLEIRYDSGDAAEYEVLEARSSLITRQVELQSMENNVAQSQQTLFKLLNAAGSIDEVSLVAEEQDVDHAAFDKSLDDYIALAEENWPAFRIARSKLAKSKVHLKKMENDALPSLDLKGGFWLSNLDEDSSGGEPFEDDFASYEIGIQFKMPLFSGKRQKSAIEMARLNMKQAKAELENLSGEVRIDLNSALQTLKNVRRQLTAMEKNLEIKQDLLWRDFEQFKVGELGADDLIEKEDETTAYQRKVMNKLIENKLNQIAFDKAVGALIEKYLGDRDIFDLGHDPEAQGPIAQKTFE